MLSKERHQTATGPEVLQSSLWQRRVERRKANVQELVKASLEARTRLIWNQSTTQQRRGYFFAGVGLTATFQDQIKLPSVTDIVVCILWSRLGTRLPGHITRSDGSRYESGTEFEFEDAKRAMEETGRPVLLVYRKMAEPLVSLAPVAKVRCPTLGVESRSDRPHLSGAVLGTGNPAT